MFILLGLTIGFFAAIPLGPVNVYVLSQTMKRDFFHGFLAGLTAAVLDVVYCMVYIMGIFHFTINMKNPPPAMKVVASVLLIFIGARLLQQTKNIVMKNSLDSKPAENGKITQHRPIIGVILLYISNPSIYIFWLGVAGTVSAHNWVEDTGWTPVVFSLACGLGSVLWYFLLVRYVSKHHGRLKPSTFTLILRILAFVLLASAALTLASLFINIKLKI